MLGRLLSRRIVALFLALGMLLGVAAPVWAAMPAKASSDMSMMMPGMAMPNTAMPNMAISGDCMGTAQHDDKNMPAKSTDNNCGMCAACGIPISAALLAEGLFRSSEAVFAHDVNRNGIAILPALPPPIA